MKLASCDFCPTVDAKPRRDCMTTTIDGRVYDICPDCRAKRDLQLQGKGEPAASNLTWVVSSGTGLQPPYRITSGGSDGYGIRPEPFIRQDN